MQPRSAALLLLLLSVTAGCLGFDQRSDIPDPDKQLELRNDWNQTVTVGVEVIRNATNATVHRGSYEIEPNTQRAVYSTAKANPEGAEYFRFVLTARNTTVQETIRTSTCYGGPVLEIAADGTVSSHYSVC
ncbi:hypothetical protein NDI56_09805 [Haloarcula sp. S1CR25-12]|uniref:Lipoprotein n=1 Tax=Haloarcula saliterrae TaxID=2950534 RepID=A0ABU2FDA1_9EURY|nr:hypothetical protein [Haloarcula sp. S1CR25-12]MDS0259685.1 hypothetical protein [Haloarcula sp. S1CR25-12]